MKKLFLFFILLSFLAPAGSAQKALPTVGKALSIDAAQKVASSTVSATSILSEVANIPVSAADTPTLQNFTQPEIRPIPLPQRSRSIVMAPVRPFLEDATLPEMPDAPGRTGKTILPSLDHLKKIFSFREKQAEKKRMAEFDSRADESVIAIQDSADDMYGATPFTATAFVIEEEFEGKKYLWGVTSAHVLNVLGPDFYVHIPGFPLPWRSNVSFMGDPGMADIAIFPIPEGQESWLNPIPLADKDPEVGEKLRSFGYFNGGFHVVRNREVQEVTKGRIITSLEFNTTERGGACGGPLLNTKNEVVGIHCGSSSKKQISFVVPVWQLKDLLTAYRNGGRAMKKLKFRNHEIGEININQYISSIRAFSNGEKIDEFDTTHQAKSIDYEHLEDLVYAEGADRREVHLSGQYNPQNPYSLKQFSYSVVYLPFEEKVFIERPSKP